jgi:hypothetical protein
MSSVPGAHGERARPSLFAEPHLLDPADISCWRLDDEAVGFAKPLVCLGKR